MSFKVGTDKRGVWFSIDHQKFRLHVEDDPNESKNDRHKRRLWFAQMLRIALKRLEGK